MIVLEQKVFETIEDHGLIQPGDRVLVAVSGGIDSVVLLDILASLRNELNLELGIAHLDHQIRPDSAIDAEFVSGIASERGFQFFTAAEDVSQYCEQHKLSPEAGARELRYRFLRRAAQEFKSDSVAMGHNLDDRAETLMMNLLRGTGIEGLASMPITRVDHGIRFIRPLYDCTRQEIEDYSLSKKLGYREDPTNIETLYTRNRIRHELMPLLKQYNPKLIESLAKTMKHASETREFLDAIWASHYQNVLLCCENQQIKLQRAALLKLNGFELSNVLRHAIKMTRGDLDGIEAVHIERVIEEIRKDQSGHEIPLIDGWIFIVEADQIHLLDQEYLEEVIEPFVFELKQPGSFEFSEIGWSFELEVLNQVPEIKNDPWEAHIDFDKIVGSMSLRNRRPGDRLRPLGLGGMKKIQDLFVDAKIPRRDRDRMPLLVDDEEIIWAVGLRMSQTYCVTPETENVLRVRAFDLRGVD